MASDRFLSSSSPKFLPEASWSEGSLRAAFVAIVFKLSSLHVPLIWGHSTCHCAYPKISGDPSVPSTRTGGRYARQLPAKSSLSKCRGRVSQDTPDIRQWSSLANPVSQSVRRHQQNRSFLSPAAESCCADTPGNSWCRYTASAST